MMDEELQQLKGLPAQWQEWILERLILASALDLQRMQGRDCGTMRYREQDRLSALSAMLLQTQVR